MNRFDIFPTIFTSLILYAQILVHGRNDKYLFIATNIEFKRICNNERISENLASLPFFISNITQMLSYTAG